MTKAEAREFLGNAGSKITVEMISQLIKKVGTSWQSVILKKASTLDEIMKYKYTPYGYRKLTTNEYVPKKYLRNFGWKNTYYQSASIIIFV